MVPVPGKGTNLHLDQSHLGTLKERVEFHSITNMAKLATPKQLDKNLRGGHECWVITYKHIKDHVDDLKAKGAKVGPKVSAGLRRYSKSTKMYSPISCRPGYRQEGKWTII